MTGTEFTTAVKDHVGDRQSGHIGSRTVDEAVLDSVNKGQRYICKRVNIQELQQSLTIDILSSDYSYALPTPTGSSTIKSILTVTLKQDSETTGRILKRLSLGLKVSWFPIMSSSRTARPIYYSYFAGSIELYPWPDDDYTAYLRVNTYPVDMVAATESPMGDEWDSAIEAYATYDIFAKLQQTQDALNWWKIFWQEYKETIGVVNKNPDLIQDMETIDHGGTNLGYEAGLDPFIRRVE